MALLLAMYQKFRLIREKNELVLKQASYSSKLSRIEKNIERTQKRYTSLFAQLESQAKQMQSQATVFFQNWSGLGANSVNPYNYSGMNGFVSNAMAQVLFGEGTKGIPIGQKDGEVQYGTLDKDTFNAMMNHYCTTGGFASYKVGDDTRYGTEDGDNWSKEQYQAFTAARNMATQQQQAIQMQTQQMSQQYSNNVSIWLEAQKAQLEVEQDAALEPLNYEQTMMELSKTQADSRLKRIQTELENYEQLASQEAEKTAPTFGLR